MSIFGIKESGSSVRTEITAGLTTFMTMAYIIFVNPAILSDINGAGMDFESVMVATCVASALATIIMAIVADYPIALAPGMGMNVFFSYEISKGMGVPWEICLGIVFLSGVIFILLTIVGIRERIFAAVPECMKYSISAGIGIFIAFIGMKNAGIIVSNSNTLVSLGNLRNTTAVVSIAGIAVMSLLIGRRIRGALFWGLIVTGIIGIVTGVVSFPESVMKTPSMSGTFLKLDIQGAFQVKYIAPVFIFLFFAMFDAIGTLIGVGEKGGFVKEGEFPRLNRALFADASGSIIGSLCGTSTVTCYIESAAGVTEGGRTGMANIITALCFLVALFFTPLAQVFTGPVVAPALIIVGALMIETITRIKWNDFTEALPAFLTIVSMPLSFSITTGLSLGFVSFAFVKALSGRGKEVHWLIYVIAILILAGYFSGL